MKREKKLLSIIDNMSDSYSENKKYIKKKLKFITELAQEGELLISILSLPCDHGKLLGFIRSSNEYINDEVFLLNIKKLDKDGNNYLQLIAKNNIYEGCLSSVNTHLFSILEKTDDNNQEKIKKFLNNLLTHKNNEQKDFLDIIIEMYHKEACENLNLYNIIRSVLVKLSDYNVSYMVDNYDRIISVDMNLKDDIISLFRADNLHSFCSLLTDDKDYNRQLIEKVFGKLDFPSENASLLYYRVYDNFDICSIEKLLEIGIDPNKRSSNHLGNNFINYAITCESDLDKIEEAIELGIKYGFDVNCEPSLLKKYVQTMKFCKNTIYFYEFLIKKGFNTYLSDIDENFIHKYNSEWNTGKEFLKMYKINFIIDGIKYKLSLKNIEVEDNFREKFKYGFDEFDRIKTRIQHFFGIENNKNFILRLTDIIIENKNKCVNANDSKVSVEEVFEALKTFIIQYNNINFDYIDRCKEKIKELK